MSARRRMLENYPKFLNVDDWSKLPVDVKRYLIEEESKKRQKEQEEAAQLAVDRKTRREQSS